MLREATKIAADQGVILAMENHIDFTARELLQLIEEVGSANFGVNFDTGNALRLFEDPVEEAKLLAPYIHATHIKDLSPRRGRFTQGMEFLGKRAGRPGCRGYSGSDEGIAGPRLSGGFVR